MSAETWTAIGTVGTAIGLLLALVALRQGQRQSRDEEAARLRAVLRSYASSFSETVALLVDGSALIDPAWRAADILTERLGPGATAERAQLLLEGGDIRLGIGIQAWASSPVSAELRESFRELAVSTQPLAGQLGFISPASDIVEGILGREDSPPLLIARLLSSEQIAQAPGGDESDGGRPDELNLRVGKFLQGMSASYFAGRYVGALKNLEDLVDTAVRSVSKLDARTLTRLARSKSTVAPTTTYTGDIKARLSEIESLVAPAEAKEMIDLAGRVETLLKKEGAAERIAELGLSKAP